LQDFENKFYRFTKAKRRPGIPAAGASLFQLFLL